MQTVVLYFLSSRSLWRRSNAASLDYELLNGKIAGIYYKFYQTYSWFNLNYNNVQNYYQLFYIAIHGMIVNPSIGI